MNELLAIFGSGFVSTFALGFQSRNVNTGQYLWAAVGSAFIALTQVTLWSHVMAPGAGWAGAVTYAVSGATAITSSMYVHKRFIKVNDRKQ